MQRPEAEWREMWVGGRWGPWTTGRTLGFTVSATGDYRRASQGVGGLVI